MGNVGFRIPPPRYPTGTGMTVSTGSPSRILDSLQRRPPLIRNRTNPEKSDQISGDRREDRRYAIELQLKYKLVRRRRVLEVGKGFTVDLSSGGILFEAERPLPIGLTVELLIDWPVLLHNVAPMRLLVTGKVVRTVGNRSAILAQQHEFRTQGSQSISAESDARTVLERRSLLSAPVQYFASRPGNPIGKMQ